MNIQLNSLVPIHEATLRFCAGTDPALEWAARGVSGYDADDDAKSRLEKYDEKAKDPATFLKDGPEKERLGHLLETATRFFHEYNSGVNVGERHFCNNDFIFIVGITRSGGTYLLTQLLEANGIDYRHLSLSMVHDGIPSYAYMLDSLTVPMRYVAAAFEFFQFLAWAQEAFDGRGTVVQKRIGYAHWLPQLDAILGDASIYIVTIRNPLHCFGSVVDLDAAAFGLEGGSILRCYLRSDMPNAGRWLQVVQKYHDVSAREWERLNAGQQFLRYWEAYYREFANTPGLKGRLVPLAYGDAYRRYIEENYPEFSKGKPGALTTSRRNYEVIKEYFGLSESMVDEAVANVATDWERNGLVFPTGEILA
ncbi:MAG: hypothetical protein O6829_05185 [Alphaproteobacteria bacterium]|nr:hypothetical protein [Alphaproteobacteria bacterium]MCZ6607592.1 hypothetical protein [Alphaproteobacteria bacterium]